MDAYKVGSYLAWRLGKKALGYYLPFRFALGNPFHAGVPWKGMEAGLKVMSGLMAK
jgi:sulfide:quinone oxidoreductase